MVIWGEKGGQDAMGDLGDLGESTDERGGRVMEEKEATHTL